MFSGLMLIVVTLFAVLGAYYLSDRLTNCIFRKKSLLNTVVLFSADAPEEVWDGICVLRSRMPEASIVVLGAADITAGDRADATARGIWFATADTIGETLRQILEGKN